MTKRCAYGLCNSDSRYGHRESMKDVFFLPFPKPWRPNHLEKCKRWVRACGRKYFSIRNVTKSSYICSKHFVGGRGPSEKCPDPINLIEGMAPERGIQNSQSPTEQHTVKQEVVGPPSATHQRPTSILEDFLEIKIKEELEYGATPDGVRVKREVDEDLTSLTWLQNNNLLKTLTLPEAGKKHGMKHEESPTSDLTAEETASDSSTNHSQLSRASQRSPAPLDTDHPGLAGLAEVSEEPRRVEPPKHYTKEKHHYSVPYDPQLHVNSKPPYSFSCLIFMAIEDSHARALPVKDIYSWITDHFPYFIKAPTGWKNSVRHNLSLNKCFRKVDKAPNLGKGSLWIVDPQYRPNLLNALSKAPYHPCASLDRPAKAPILPPSALSQQQDLVAVKCQSRLPNPELFPYLSRRLAASEADRVGEAEDWEEDSLDDVDAAAAMLELKHGQNSQSTGPRQHVQQRNKWRPRQDDMIPVISTSPSEDHTYTADQTTTAGNSVKRVSVSPDEAYGGGSDSDEDSSRPYGKVMKYGKSLMLGRHDPDEDSWSSDGAEQRNVASALLHLAGGTGGTGSTGGTGGTGGKPPPHGASHPHSHHLPQHLPQPKQKTHRVKKGHHRPSILQRPKKAKHSRQAESAMNNNNNDKMGAGRGAKGGAKGVRGDEGRYPHHHQPHQAHQAPHHVALAR